MAKASGDARQHREKNFLHLRTRDSLERGALRESVEGNEESKTNERVVQADDARACERERVCVSECGDEVSMDEEREGAEERERTLLLYLQPLLLQ